MSRVEEMLVNFPYQNRVGKTNLHGKEVECVTVDLVL